MYINPLIHYGYSTKMKIICVNLWCLLNFPLTKNCLVWHQLSLMILLVVFKQ